MAQRILLILLIFGQNYAYSFVENYDHLNKCYDWLGQETHNSPGYLLLKVSLQWKARIEDVLKQFDLTHPQFIILATTAWLTQDRQKVSQIDISRTAGLDPNTTSQILRGLEKKKLIKRMRSLNERNKNPILTEIGKAILTQAVPAVEATDQFFFDRLNQHEMAQFMQIFTILMSK